VSKKHRGQRKRYIVLHSKIGRLGPGVNEVPRDAVVLAGDSAFVGRGSRRDCFPREVVFESREKAEKAYTSGVEPSWVLDTREEIPRVYLARVKPAFGLAPKWNWSSQPSWYKIVTAFGDEPSWSPRRGREEAELQAFTSERLALEAAKQISDKLLLRQADEVAAAQAEYGKTLFSNREIHRRLKAAHA